MSRRVFIEECRQSLLNLTAQIGGQPVVGVLTIVIGLAGAGSLLAPTTRGALDRN